MGLHHLALPLILALSALGLAWSVVPARRPDAEDPEAIERGSTTIMPEDR